MIIKLTAGTNVGCVRTNNEDNFITNVDLSRSDWFLPKDSSDAVVLSDEGCALVVADGMGGHNAGDYASKYTVETIVKEISEAKDDNPVTIIKNAIGIANEHIRED